MFFSLCFYRSIYAFDLETVWNLSIYSILRLFHSYCCKIS